MHSLIINLMTIEISVRLDKNWKNIKSKLIFQNKKCFLKNFKQKHKIICRNQIKFNQTFKQIMQIIIAILITATITKIMATRIKTTI